MTPSVHSSPSGLRPLHLWLVHALVGMGVCLCLCVMPAPAQEADPDTDLPRQDGNIWGALFFATNQEVEEAEDEQTRAVVERLRKAFDEPRFQLLGEHTQAIFSEYESWVVPSKDLYLSVDSKGPVDGGTGLSVHLQLWLNKDVLLKTDVVLRDTPIFIRGPRWGDGYLVMAVQLK